MTTHVSFLARCGLALLSGAVFSLAFPPLGWRWMVIPGLAGLLLCLKGLSGTRARTVGFLHGLAAYALGLSWMFEIFGTLVVALWFVLAAFTALFAEFQSRAGLRGITGWKLAIFTTINWCGWEFIRAELFPLKFPWMTAGLALGPNALLPWIGVYGVSFAIVLAVALLVGRKWIGAIAMVGVIIFSTILHRPVPPPTEGTPKTLKVAGLQLENVTLDAFLNGTRELPSDIQYVVWPEYAVPYDIRNDLRDWKLVQNLCRERDITLTFGTQLHAGRGRGWHNIALTVDPSGTLGQHNKVHTVHFFNDGTPGTTAVPISTSHGKIGTPICFDCDYEGVVRNMTAAGAEAFVVPVMDAESWTARQHDQHAELFRIRACENGRWMFVCATSGVSQVIDPHGHVHARLPALAQGPLVGSLQRETGYTGYTRIGWLTPWCLLGIGSVMWVLLMFPRKPEIHRPFVPSPVEPASCP